MGRGTSGRPEVTPAQLDLFDAPVRSGAHRHSDRQSSVDAARSMSGDVLNKQQLLILTRLSWVPDANAYEVSKALSFRVQPNVVSRRFDDLELMGMAERTGTKREGSSKRMGDVWRCTRKGHQWLQGEVDVPTGTYL